MHELALLAGLAARAVGAHDEDLGVRDRLADRVGPAVDLGGVEVGRAERLGEPVHQEGLGEGEDRAQLAERGARHPAAGVGEVAQAARRLGRPLLLGELDPQRRHAREPGDLVLGAQADDVARQQVVDEHDVGADGERGRELAEAGVEAQRQRGEDDVVLDVAEVLADARAAGQDVAVREHDALRLAGAARGVEDRRHVDVDDVGLRDRVAAAAERLPGVQLQVGGRLGGGAEHDDVLDGGLLELVAQQLEALRGRDEDAHAAVVEDVGDLLGLEHRVDRDEHAAGGRGAEDRDDGLDPLVEVDADALAALEPELAQPGGERRHLVPQLAVGERRVLERERGGGGATARRVGDDLVQLRAHRAVSLPLVRRSHQETQTSSLYR